MQSVNHRSRKGPQTKLNICPPSILHFVCCLLCLATAQKIHRWLTRPQGLARVPGEVHTPAVKGKNPSPDRESPATKAKVSMLNLSLFNYFPMKICYVLPRIVSLADPFQDFFFLKSVQWMYTSLPWVSSTFNMLTTSSFIHELRAWDGEL